jgi:rRNA-processing protein FCF1
MIVPDTNLLLYAYDHRADIKRRPKLGGEIVYLDANQ